MFKILLLNSNAIRIERRKKTWEYLCENFLKKEEALKLAREIERAKQDTTEEISVAEATTIIAEQYKKAQSLATTQEKELNKIINDIIPPGTDIDNDQNYIKETGKVLKDLN